MVNIQIYRCFEWTGPHDCSASGAKTVLNWTSRPLWSPICYLVICYPFWEFKCQSKSWFLELSRNLGLLLCAVMSYSLISTTIIVFGNKCVNINAELLYCDKQGSSFGYSEAIIEMFTVTSPRVKRKFGEAHHTHIWCQGIGLLELNRYSPICPYSMVLNLLIPMVTLRFNF
jgi:hypothetical protein